MEQLPNYAIHSYIGRGSAMENKAKKCKRETANEKKKNYNEKIKPEHKCLADLINGIANTRSSNTSNSSDSRSQAINLYNTSLNVHDVTTKNFVFYKIECIREQTNRQTKAKIKME